MSLARKKGSWGKNPKVKPIRCYPKLPFKLDRRRKVSDRQAQKIRFLYAQGYSITRLAFMMKLARSTIQYHAISSYREYCRERDKGRIRFDMQYQANKEMSRQYTMSIYPKAKQYASYKRRMRNHKKLKEQGVEVKP